MYISQEYRSLLDSESKLKKAMELADEKSLASLVQAHVKLVALKMQWRKDYRARGKTIPVESSVVDEIPQIEAPPTGNQETVTAPPTPEREVGDGG